MKNAKFLTILALGILAATGKAQDSTLSFFITGSAMGQGGNLGGLSGADAHCQKLADSVGAGTGKVWRAYLSTQPVGNVPGENARDRIGVGPWFNANRIRIAANLEELHDTANITTVTFAKGLTHRGVTVATSKHDVMTGSRFNGMAPAAGADSTCSNWTSSASGLPGRAIVGHHNRSGIASNMIANSWNQAHVTSGCSQSNVEAGGGSGFFYCFVASTVVGIDSRNFPRESKAMNGAVAYYLSADRSPKMEDVVYRFTLDREAHIEVAVFDLEGRERAVLLRTTRGAGRHEVRWNGMDAGGAPLPAGLYPIVFKRDGILRSQ